MAFLANQSFNLKVEPVGKTTSVPLVQGHSLNEKGKLC